MYVARLNFNILGRAGYGEGDLAYSEKPQLAVGGGYSYNPGVNTSTDNAFVGLDLANLNIRRQLAAFGNGRQLGLGIVDYSTWAVDGVFKYRGFSLQGEFFFKNINRHEKGIALSEYERGGGLHGHGAQSVRECHGLLRAKRVLSDSQNGGAGWLDFPIGIRIPILPMI